MKRARFFFCTWCRVALLLAPVFVHAQSVRQLDAVRLRTLNQKPVSLADFHKPLTAIIFLSPDCPICQNYAATLKNLQKTYQSEVILIGIFPGNGYSTRDYQRFRDTYRLNFTLLVDRPNALSKILGATTTPEVFLLNANRDVMYTGAIDDWVVALGRKRSKPTQLYLADAIAAYTSGQLIRVPKTPAVGCFINDI